jgi:ABC-type multidrug transport system fused ATPase/permease subunit
MWSTVKKILDLLEPRDRRRAWLLLGMILVMGILETLGVASIMPFVAVLANPSLVENNVYIRPIYDWIGFDSPRSFILLLGFVVLGLAISTTVFKAVTNWSMLHFSTMRNFALSQRLFKGYLYRPYAWFLRRHSADLSKTVFSEVGQVIGGAMMPALQLAAQGTIVVLLLALLLAVDPILALTLAVVLGGIYGLVFWTTRRYVDRIGADRVKANKERFRVSSEAFGGIKDVKLLGLEKSYLRRFEEPSMRFVRHQISNQLIVQFPHYALQIMTVSGVLLIVQYQTFTSGGVGQALPLIALYALAGYRLLPAVQKVYQNISSLRFAHAALDTLHQDLVETATGLHGELSANSTSEALALKQNLALRNVTFTYPSASMPALVDLNITIPARSTVGIVGRTGAGKTTAVDIILGLLKPNQGEIIVDNKGITETNLRAWQKSLGYVPQHIFLIDDTVAANVAFGVPPSDIDLDAVERAARLANLHAFVSKELSDGYQTLIGERGMRLSGGQRQRVGIARALYHDPDILIMDEATSALDNITERAVIEAVNNLARRKTIVIIAHRLTTVRRCDLIFLLDHGRLLAQGTYDELAGNSAPFREMVAATMN